MPITYPNQRTIHIHREKPRGGFLGIKNENWQAAARNLGAHALKLYLYLASNADNYELALSQVAVREEIGMARSTFHDQFHVLVDKGYLVPARGNTYDFYEVPQPRPDKDTQSSLLTADTSVTIDGQAMPPVGIDYPSEGKEINNNRCSEDKSINNIEAFRKWSGF